MRKIGFIGLGLMGYPMALNIARAGFPLTVFNRTRVKAERLAQEANADVAETPRAVAERSEVVITMVSDVPDVEAVYLGADGIREAARPGLVCIDMGTVGADCVRRVGAALAEHGTGLLDAPVSGGVWGAQQGTLSIMAGGSDDDFHIALPVFEAMGKKIVHCGPLGTGQTTKLVNQVVGAVNLEAVCEGMKLAEASGADVGKVIEAVGAGAAGSWAWSNLGPRILNRDFEPGFKIAHQIKDLRLALEAAEAAGISLPGARLVLEQMRIAAATLPDGENRGTQGMYLVVGAKE
ncbi:MAG: NAD(P)-dependent oxidoreductase [Capsulimonadales bacterium]|nr:NAD(P)-dependent oxidoreductase [Capsulimonadales bacterium]